MCSPQPLRRSDVTKGVSKTWGLRCELKWRCCINQQFRLARLLSDFSKIPSA